MNTLAIVTIILAFVFSVAGIVTGHIALKQIDSTGESGRGLAKAGLILSYVFTGLAVLLVIAYIVFIVLAIAFAGAASYSSY
jgi:peptidyl-prolyl cis-trans isomerase B (cyclophilin B)